MKCYPELSERTYRITRGFSGIRDNIFFGITLEILPPSLNVTRGRKNTGDACEKIKRMILPEQNTLEIMVICYKMKYNQIKKIGSC